MHLKEIAFLASRSQAAVRDFYSVYMMNGHRTMIVMEARSTPDDLGYAEIPRDTHGYLPYAYFVDGTSDGTEESRLEAYVDVAGNDYYGDLDDVAYGISSDGSPIYNTSELTGMHEVYRRYATSTAVYGISSGGSMYVEPITRCLVAVFTNSNGTWDCSVHRLKYREVVDVPNGSVVKVIEGDARVISSTEDVGLVSHLVNDSSVVDTATVTAELLKLGSRVTSAEEQYKSELISIGSSLPQTVVRSVVSGPGPMAVGQLLYLSGVVPAVRRIISNNPSLMATLTERIRLTIEDDRDITSNWLRNYATDIVIRDLEDQPSRHAGGRPGGPANAIVGYSAEEGRIDNSFTQPFGSNLFR